jgi:hypothetical protein
MLSRSFCTGVRPGSSAGATLRSWPGTAISVCAMSSIRSGMIDQIREVINEIREVSDDVGEVIDEVRGGRR